MLADYRTAPIGEPLRATLAFVEKLTLRSDEVGPDDVAALRGHGLSDQAIADAVHVCAIFNVIDRVADALAFDVPTPEAFARGARVLLKRGYL